MSAYPFKDLRDLADRVGREITFAEAGKDLGLLPVNCLVGQMEELAAQHGLPKPVAEGINLARSWVDGIFETSGAFDAACLERLGQWSPWIQSVAKACEENTTPPQPSPKWQANAASLTAPPAAPSAAPQERPKPTQEPEIILNLESDRELLNEFINESQEHLQNIEQGVLVLEENPADADTLNSIFRAFHTFKGGSGFLNLTAIQSLAHELESLLELARQHKLPITPKVINVILAGGDALKQFVSEIAAHLSGAKPPGPIIVPTLRLLDSIRAVLANDSSAEAEAERPAAEAQKHPPGDSPTSATTATATAVKVDTLKLDTLIDLVGEMVIAQSLVVQNEVLATVQNEKLVRDLARLSRISQDLQRSAMALRMVPIRATFQKMNRLVRDLSVKLSKQIELVTEGEDTELDRTIVEEISDPLIHMIRNSVDHGIEKPEDRVKHGKAAKGTVSLKAFHRGGNIVIEIKDDGGGLNRERILAKAVEQGVIKKEDTLSESEIFSLIMAPGFSTAEKVTDVSGRGVGMDVVRRNIERLRGKIEIQSTPGQGSCFSIYLPLTLAIIDGLLVGIGGHRYILPTLSVCESFQPAPGMIQTIQGRGETITVRGRLRPLLRLAEHLGITPASTDPTRSIVVVVESGSDARCILVDQLLGKQEVVIKSLGETFRANRCVAGAAILGDGRIGLILDPQALVHLETNTLKEAA